MKVIIVGGVAAGTKVAAKLKRECKDMEVIIFNKDKNISYAGCGLPYYVSKTIENREQLIVNTPEKFQALTGAKVFANHEVVSINREEKTVEVIDHNTGEKSTHNYDKLVLSCGASPIKPNIEGIDLENVFFMRSPEDAIMLREAVESKGLKKAIVAGGGFIGLEVAENLAKIGVRPIVVDMAENVLPGFDKEMCEFVERHLAENGVMTLTSTKIEGILGEGKVEKVKTDKRALKADMLVMSVGIRPNTEFVKSTGLDMAANGAIIVDENMRTNDDSIYAAGDCVVVKNLITEKMAYSPMGSSANMEGRVLAQNIAGKNKSYKGVLGTAVCKLPELNVGRTGLTEQQAKNEGYEPISVITVLDDKAHYYPDHANFYTKMIADKNTGKLLGLQVIGSGNVDKMIDIAVVSLTMKAKLSDLENMDMAYAPPFSTAIHPFVTTLNVLVNKMEGNYNTFTPREFAEGKAEGYRIIDVCLAPTIEGAPYVDLAKVNDELEGYGKEEKLLFICNRGRRAYMLQNKLKQCGYVNTKVLEGGTLFNDLSDIEF